MSTVHLHGHTWERGKKWGSRWTISGQWWMSVMRAIAHITCILLHCREMFSSHLCMHVSQNNLAGYLLKGLIPFSGSNAVAVKCYLINDKKEMNVFFDTTFFSTGREQKIFHISSRQAGEAFIEKCFSMTACNEHNILSPWRAAISNTAIKRHRSSAATFNIPVLTCSLNCFKRLFTSKISRDIWVSGVGLEENRRISEAFVPRANIANAICQRQDSDERHPGRTVPIEAPDWCPQRTWAGADAWLPLLLCNQVATESKCRMAWCDMSSHTESSARQHQA